MAFLATRDSDPPYSLASPLRREPERTTARRKVTPHAPARSSVELRNWQICCCCCRPHTHHTTHPPSPRSDPPPRLLSLPPSSALRACLVNEHTTAVATAGIAHTLATADAGETSHTERCVLTRVIDPVQCYLVVRACMENHLTWWERRAITRKVTRTGDRQAAGRRQTGVGWWWCVLN